MCRLSWNLGVSSSWNPQGLPRPVMGLLYLLQIPDMMICNTRLFFTGKVRYVGIVYVVFNVQQIYIFRILLYILKSTIVSVCIKHAQYYSSLLSWKSGYDPRRVFMGFMVDKVALGAVPLKSLSVSSHQYDSTNASFSFISLHYSSSGLPHCIQHASMKETTAVDCGQVCPCVPTPSSTEPAS
jgi:hypothetical protein